MILFLVQFWQFTALANDGFTDWAERDVKKLDASVAALDFLEAPVGKVQVSCRGKDLGHKVLRLKILGPKAEQPAILYHALQEMGFSFPNPRDIIKNFNGKDFCGKEILFNPKLKKRGFHFHTQHPNEWVLGFFMGETQIVENSLAWLLRNQINTLELELIRLNREQERNLSQALKRAKDLRLNIGLSLSFAMIQQKSYHLLPFWRALSGLGDEQAIIDALDTLEKKYDFDFLTLELGSTEFTSFGHKKTIRWLDTVNRWGKNHNKKIFVKVHVSSNQKVNGKNYNFIAEGMDIGLFVHTVYQYGLESPRAPVYGRKDFSDIRDFLLRTQSQERWYFPETSYFIGLDLDVPLFLTAYLTNRMNDIAFLGRHNLDAQIVFSSGQEVGYWLMDWVTALAMAGEISEPIEALGLLGENREAWKEIITYQSEYLEGVLPMLVGSNILDELGVFSLLKRNTLRKLRKDAHLRDAEIRTLELAIKQRPALERIKNTELRLALQLTWLRMDHALAIRQSLRDAKYLQVAAKFREQGKNLAEQMKKGARYPRIFEIFANPTSYAFGYGWTVAELSYWEREEEQIRQRRFDPFFKNIYDVWNILF